MKLLGITKSQVMQYSCKDGKKGLGEGGLVGINNTLTHMQIHLTEWKSDKFGDVKWKNKKVRKSLNVRDKCLVSWNLKEGVEARQEA
jgi:hypothetical protein